MSVSGSESTAIPLSTAGAWQPVKLPFGLNVPVRNPAPPPFNGASSVESKWTRTPIPVVSWEGVVLYTTVKSTGTPAPAALCDSGLGTTFWVSADTTPAIKASTTINTSCPKTRDLNMFASPHKPPRKGGPTRRNPPAL
jgi:hypothetical protein